MYIYTPEDLLQFVYNETSIEKTAAINAALEQDWSLNEKLELIQTAQNRLETLTLSPRTEVLDRILNYAEEVNGEVHAH